jgi:hypothetical protein
MDEDSGQQLERTPISTSAIDYEDWSLSRSSATGTKENNPIPIKVSSRGEETSLFGCFLSGDVQITVIDDDVIIRSRFQ